MLLKIIYKLFFTLNKTCSFKSLKCFWVTKSVFSMALLQKAPLEKKGTKINH